MSDALTLRKVADADAARLAEIFLTSRKTAMPWLAQPHTDDETRWWHINVLLPRGTVVVAERHGNVVGFAEPSDGWLHALYIAPSAQGSGVGSALFEHSMTLQPSGFDLWVFQRNTRALDFYARYGCAEVRRTDGSETKSTSPTSSCAGRPATEGAARSAEAARLQTQTHRLDQVPVVAGPDERGRRPGTSRRGWVFRPAS